MVAEKIRQQRRHAWTWTTCNWPGFFSTRDVLQRQRRVYGLQPGGGARKHLHVCVTDAKNSDGDTPLAMLRGGHRAPRVSGQPWVRVIHEHRTYVSLYRNKPTRCPSFYLHSYCILSSFGGHLGFASTQCLPSQGAPTPYTTTRYLPLLQRRPACAAEAADKADSDK